ncbi:MAG: hypothetical protein ACFHX7_08500 [Pseudomonadota bacterium]
MSSVIYAIVFSGEIVEGFQKISVKAHMAKMLKADVEKMATLFSGKQVVLKRTNDKQEALKYGSALKKVGADVKIKAIKSEAPLAAKAPATTETGGLTLAPNEGYLVEPKPAPPPPAVNISSLSLADNNDLPLAPPRQQPEVHLDLSGLSVSENDGSPLVEPVERPVPKVEAPDFGLDEPGAVLETLQEKKVLLNPDTSALSIAAAGADLLDEKDRKPAPPPRVPDVSNIQLAPPA